jgi:hypothetical protein
MRGALDRYGGPIRYTQESEATSLRMADEVVYSRYHPNLDRSKVAQKSSIHPKAVRYGFLHRDA